MSQAIDTKRGRGRPKKAPVSTQDQRIASQITARANILRATREEDIRQRISGSNILTRLEKIQADLVSIHSVELDAVQVQRLGKAAEISLRLLGKILPDLKSVEVTKRTEEVITIDQVSEAERHSINAAISRALGIVEVGGGGVAQDIRADNYMTPSPRHEISENDISEGEYRDADSGVGSHSTDSEE